MKYDNKILDSHKNFDTFKGCSLDFNIIINSDNDIYIKYRKKIANILSKKKKFFIDRIGYIDALRYVKSLSSLDDLFNKNVLSEKDKEKALSLYDSLPEFLKEEIKKIIVHEVHN